MQDPKLDSPLIDRLVADGAPVRRLWSPALRLVSWLALFAAVVGGVALRHGWPFASPDRSPGLALEVIVAAVAAAVWAALAFRAAVPGREPTRMALARAAALALLPGLFWLWGAARVDTPVDTFVARGIPCVLWTAIWSLALLVPLLWAQARGASLAPRRAAGLAGGAAFIGGYALMRLVCGVDDPAHLLVWHALPLPLGAAIVALAASSLLARWRG